MKKHTLVTLGLATLLASAPQAYSQEQLAKRMQEAPAETALNRTVLPIPEPDYPRSTVLDARDAKPPPRFEVNPPRGAPNVLIVLIDDMGFGMPSAFGGPVPRRWSHEAQHKQLET